jgi:hypothetical protein
MKNRVARGEFGHMVIKWQKTLIFEFMALRGRWLPGYQRFRAIVPARRLRHTGQKAAQILADTVQRGVVPVYTRAVREAVDTRGYGRRRGAGPVRARGAASFAPAERRPARSQPNAPD